MFDISAVRTLALETTDERTNEWKHLLSNMRACLTLARLRVRLCLHMSANFLNTVSLLFFSISFLVQLCIFSLYYYYECSLSLYFILMLPVLSLSSSLFFFDSFTHRKSFHLPIYFNPRKNLWDIINVEKYLWDVEKPVTPFCRRLQTDKCETTKKFKLLFPISRMNERYRNKF
jgi:hypothetical protein